jgi:hypothetical protein
MLSLMLSLPLTLAGCGGGGASGLEPVDAVSQTADEAGDGAAQASTQSAEAVRVLRRAPVAVGGVDGLEVLARPSSTTELRKAGVQFHLHWDGWVALGATEAERADLQRRIVTLFGVRSVVAELPMVGADASPASPVGSLKTAGIVAMRNMMVNAGGTPPDADGWAGFINQWKSAGLGVERMAYIETPNDTVAPPDLSFASSRFDGTRMRAQLGGLLVVDSPPTFYYWQPESYRRWVRDAVAWANAQGIVSAIIVSPQGDPNSTADSEAFAAATRMLVGEFNALPANQRPSMYYVENYGAGAAIGKETDGNSVAGVALWTVRNALTYRP